MQVLPGVRIVASGWLGYSLTADQDCTVYLLEDGGDAVLVDAGCGLAGDAIVRHIAGTPVSRILLTHAHADHAAGAADLVARLGMRVLAAPECARIVASADEDAASLSAARAAGVYPQRVQLAPVTVERIQTSTLTVGTRAVEVLATPGHAVGHVCYLIELNGTRVLFSGDVVFSRGRVAILATPDTDVGALHNSLEMLLLRRPDVLLPGHGEVVLGDATRHLRRALDAFDAGRLPPGLL